MINGTILALLLYIGATAKHVIEEHKYEMTTLIVPNTPPPPKPKLPEPPKVKLPEPPKPVEVKMEAPKINVPKPEPKTELKPIQMEAKVALPEMKAAKPAVVMAPQPKAALDRSHACTGQQPEAVDRTGSSWPDVRRHTESECDASGNRGGNRKPLRRNAGSCRVLRTEWLAQPELEMD